MRDARDGGASDDGGLRFETYAENPLRHVHELGGVKDNVGKPRMDLIPPRVLRAVAEVLEFGTRKYKPNNWRLGLSWEETYGSLQRHLVAWHDLEDVDPETGLLHLSHAACQVMFLLEFALTSTGEDDRWRGPAAAMTANTTRCLCGHYVSAHQSGEGRWSGFCGDCDCERLSVLVEKSS